MTKNENNEFQKKDFTKLRKLLLTAALSVALISWYTTANGLNRYVFTHLWQAYVISAALQGALFALSIKGIDMFFNFKKWYKKFWLLFVWIILLCTSSIFSYIFISSDVYTDKLLREDAQRILNTFCLEENYKLLSTSNKLLSDASKGVEPRLIEYVKILAVTENGIEFSESDKKEIDNLKKLLLPYTYNEMSTNGDTIDNDEYADTTFLINYIDVILTGKYTDNDLETLKSEINSVLQSISQKRMSIINNQKAKEKIATEFQERLKTFRETSSDAYKDTTTQLNDILSQITSEQNKISNLESEKEIVIKVSTIINNINSGMEAILYNQVLSLYSEMNAEEINIEKTQKIAEEIYNILLENGVTADDQRLVKYADFRSNLRKYKILIEAKQDIEKEIEELYTLTNIVIAEETCPEPEENTENELQENETQDDESQKNKTKDDETQENETKDDKDIWTKYWQERLNSLKHIVQTLHRSDIDISPDDITSLSSIEVRERLYLSDLNDFEKAFTLLFGSTPVHPYKVLLVFSFFFSFGIDLFSVLMSVLLYIFRDTTKENEVI